MNKAIRKKRYIAPKITEIDMENTTILAGSDENNVNNDGSQGNFSGSEGTNGSWDGAKAPMRQYIDEWGEEE